MSLELKSLSKRFGAVKAVDDVSLTVGDGEFFSLLGPSGCGKTTLLRSIAGILQPDAGTIALDGRDITSVPVHARNTALVFQSYALFPHLTVFENIAFGLRMRREKEAAIRRRVDEALDLVRLGGMGERFPAQISGGQQQRVALARALVVRPALLLLDEPLSNLDARLREEMRVEIRRIQRAVGITTILVTHDIQEAFALSDRIAVMNQGKAEQIGTPADIYLRPATQFVAEFAGQVNHFTGRVVRVEAGRVEIATADGTRFWIAPAGALPAVGEETAVILRPERVRLGAAGCANQFSATVEDVTYLGGLTLYRLKLGEHRLLAQAQNLGAPAHGSGATVTVGWEAEDGVSLAGREAAAPSRGAARWLPALFVLPLCLVLTLVFVWPLLDGTINSFHPFTRAGIDRSTWTLANYGKLADSFYFGILMRTVKVSLIVTAITAVLAYPVAIYIVGLTPRAQAFYLLIYMTPWLVNVVVKAFGWSLLLSANGVINQSLKAVGIIDSPIRLMLNETGIVIGLTHGHFIFVLLPLWAALSGLDPNIRWAAANLGARGWDVFRRVTLPLTLPALLAGLIINFTMNMTAFATPALLGGARARVVSFLAYEVNLVELNWPLGSAMAVAMLAISLVLIWLSQRAATSGSRRALFDGAPR